MPAVPVYDDFGDDDGYGDSSYQAAPPRRSSAKKKKAKASSGGMPLPLMIGGGLLGAGLVIAVVLFAFGGRSAPNPAGDVDVAATAPADPGLPPPGSDAAAALARHKAEAEQRAAENRARIAAMAESTSNTADTDPAGTETSQPAAQPANSNTPTALPGSGTETVWVVLSDFKEQNSSGGGGKTLNIQYRVVSGAPDPSRTYVLFVGSSMGMMTRYQEVDLNLNNANGTVAVPVSIGMNAPTAYVAWKKGLHEWEPVSGEIQVGGQPTDPKRPPTVLEAAGADAQGKLLALANARFETSRMRQQALVVDYVLQQPVDFGLQYVLVIQGQGDPMHVRINTSLMRATPGKKDQLAVSPIGGRFPEGDLTIRVEKRQLAFGRETPEVVSNSVRVQR
ncbi:MAG: hypothetical protein R3C59_12325 [Planctomycetaceae bacterium]